MVESLWLTPLDLLSPPVTSAHVCTLCLQSCLSSPCSDTWCCRRNYQLQDKSFWNISLVKFKINKDQKLFNSFKRNCRWYIVYWSGREKLWITKRGWGIEDLWEMKWEENKAEWLSHDHRLYDTSLGNNTLPSLCNLPTWPLHYIPQQTKMSAKFSYNPHKHSIDSCTLMPHLVILGKYPQIQ